MLTPSTLAFVLLGILTAQVDPQLKSGRIGGIVRDAQGGALAGADVDIACGHERRRVTTSASGEFAATALPAGPCSVSARSEAFEPETISVDARTGERATVVLQVRRFAAEVVVTPSRGVGQRSFNVPDAMSITTRRDIDTRPYTLLPQVLREEPGILLQQTTSAQVSPIIRGFTGQSNVYLLDGVRLNTGQWRSGPSQYVSWIDAGPVDSIEVVRGGGSVQYGSDALGGTVQFLTSPTIIGTHSARLSGEAELSAATAASSLSAQGGLAFQAAGSSVRVGVSRQHVNDLRAGGGLDSHSAVTRFLGLPSTLLGDRMPATGFDQGGAHAVASFAWGNGSALRAMYMHEAQTGAARYDRLLGGEGLYRSGFDPQTLDFGMVRYTRTDLGMVDGLSVTFSVNRQADGRFEQARPTARLDRQDAITTALGYQAQGHRAFGPRQQLVVGAELYDESIAASRDLVEANVPVRARPDVPDGTSYTSVGIFAQHVLDVVPNRLTLRGGARYSGFRFATKSDPELGVIEERVTASATTFQVAAVYRLTPGVNLTASVNRGFRAANAADFGSIGLTGGGGFEITPSTASSLGAFIGTTGATGAVSTGQRVPQLSPEVVYQYELGVKAALGRFSAAVNGFAMQLHDFIQRRALVFDTSIVGTTLSGFDVVRMDQTGLAYIAQDVRPIATRVNVDRARVTGFDAEGAWRLNSGLTASAYFSTANGRVLPDGEYLRRMPPPLGGAKLRWTRERIWTEGVLSFAGSQTRFNSGDSSDARIGALRTRASIATFFQGTATDMGLVSNGVLAATGESLSQVQDRLLGPAASAALYTSQPGFAVVGVRAGFRVTPSLDLSILGENLADVNYRLYGSGLDAPGINVQVRTRYRF
jgi:outer membrane receptor protein involved in Fe transport